MTELLDQETDLPVSAGEDDMRQFLREIRTIPRLSAEEEKELARRVGMPEEKVKELMRLSPEVCSLDVPTGEGDDGVLGALVEDTLSPQPYEELVRQELEKTMRDLLSRLNERQQKILGLHFGMEDGICYSLEEIGKKLGISKERVRQIERQAMDKLQKDGESLGLEDFLNE